MEPAEHITDPPAVPPVPQPAPDAALVAAAEKLAAAADKFASITPADLTAAATKAAPEPVSPDLIKQLAAHPDVKAAGFNRKDLEKQHPDFIRMLAENVGIPTAATPPPPPGSPPKAPSPPPGDNGTYGFAGEPPKKPPVDILYPDKKDRPRVEPAFKGDSDRTLSGIHDLVRQLVDQGKDGKREKDKKPDRAATGGESLLDRALEFVGRRGGRVGRIVHGAVGHHKEITGLLGRAAPAAAGEAGAAAGGEAAAGAGAAAGLGMAVPVVGAVVAATVALVELAKAGRDAAYSQEQFNRQLAEFSPSQGAIAGQMDARRAMRKLDLGESTAGSSQSLTGAIDRFERATLPIEKLATSVGNMIGARVMDSLAGIAEMMTPLVDALNAVAKEKAIEPVSFGDFLDRVHKEETDQAAARRAAVGATGRALD